MKSIQIDSLNGKNLNIQLDDFANDSMIHEKIADTLNIPVEEQTLIPVKDDEYLLVPKMKGGVIFLAGKALSLASKVGRASKKANKAVNKVKKTAKKEAKKLSKKKGGMFSFLKKGKAKNKNKKNKNKNAKKKKKNNSDSESNSKNSSDTESTEDSESSTESESSKTVSTNSSAVSADKSSSSDDQSSASDKSSVSAASSSDDQSSASDKSSSSDNQSSASDKSSVSADKSSVSEKSDKSDDSSKKSLFSYKTVSFSKLESIDKNGLYFCLVVSLAMLLTTIFSNSLEMVFIGNVIIFFSLFLSQKRFFLSGKPSYYKRVNLIFTLIYLFFNTIFYLIIHFTKKSKITQIIFSLLSLLPIPYLFLIRN